MGKLMVFGLALACGAMSSAAAEKHYLAAGWDVGSLYPEDFVDSLDELAKVPVDGIRFAVRGQTADGQPIDQAKAMDGIRWPDDAFDGELENVRRLTALPNMRHCFMAMRAAPNRRLRWDDDAAWEMFAHNAGVLASFAKRAGVKGLCPDYEDYVHQYQYRLADDDPDYETTRALVRKRGAQVYGAVFRAFPEAIMFHWHFLDAPWCGFDFSGDVAAYYRDARNLFPAFLEGGLDALPPTGRFVAAEERDYSYRASRRDFYKAYADEKRVEPSLVSPENLLKLRTQVSVGFDLYLDAYRPDNTNSVYFHAPEKGRTLAEQFLVDLEQATQATDEYVWFWGEKRAYAKWVNPGVKQKRTWIQRWGKTETWDETLPGLYDGMRRIKDPQGYVRKAIAAARASGAPNLAPSGDCTDAKAFTFWQESRFTNGTFRIDRETGCRQPGCALMSGVHGCVSTFVRNRAAGERFAIRLVSRTDGDAAASAPVHFTSGSKWNFKVPGKRIERTGRSKDGWTEHLGWIEIPEGCDGFGLQLGSYARPGDEVRFDDIEVYALPSLTSCGGRENRL